MNLYLDTQRGVCIVLPVSVFCEKQEKLMDVRGGAISLSQMCNEPCFVSVTFGLIDHEQRPLHMRDASLLQTQHGVR